MGFKIQPVVFGGVDWTSRAKVGLQPAPTPRDRAEKRLPELREGLADVEWAELCEVNSPDEIGRLVEASRGADMVLALASELLVVKTAAKALAAVRCPVTFIGEEKLPTPVFCDVYGCLTADGHDVHLAIDTGDLQTIVRAIRAKTRLANTKALLIGDGYPSHSQVANPDSPRVIEDKLGVQVVQRSIADLRRLWEAADEAEANSQAQAWLDGADHVADAAKRDIAQSAKMYLAMKAMVEEVGANALSIDCRAWDLISCQDFGAFYSPCMGLTTLRWQGIPASCEADLCAMLTMCVLNYVSGLPAFLGNIGKVDREKNSVGIGGHAACTVNMDGESHKLEGYRLTDYGGRGGVASYCSVQGGKEITVARLDKNLRRISVAAGRTVPTDRCFEVIVGDVEDFVHRCLTGDHYIVVCGNHLKEVSLLAHMLDIGVLTPVATGQGL